MGLADQPFFETDAPFRGYPDPASGTSPPAHALYDAAGRGNRTRGKQPTSWPAPAAGSEADAGGRTPVGRARRVRAPEGPALRPRPCRALNGRPRVTGVRAHSGRAPVRPLHPRARCACAAVRPSSAAMLRSRARTQLFVIPATASAVSERRNRPEEPAPDGPEGASAASDPLALGAGRSRWMPAFAGMTANFEAQLRSIAPHGGEGEKHADTDRPSKCGKQKFSGIPPPQRAVRYPGRGS